MTDELKRRQNLTFSQAEGLTELPRQLNREEMPRAFRLDLWKLLYECSEIYDPSLQRYIKSELDIVARALWANCLCKPVDKFPEKLLSHNALSESFQKLYGYTCDENGIRHSLLENGAANVGEEEALFMFGACACGYLCRKRGKMKV